jgi:1,4-alpha-glucan branching enzyme
MVAPADTAAHGLSQRDARALAAGACGDPFRVLGPQPVAGRWVIRAFVPGAETVEAVAEGEVISSLDHVSDGVFAGAVAGEERPGAYVLRCRIGETVWEEGDPYQFGPMLGELDEHLISEGAHLDLWRVLGAHPVSHEGA